SSRRRHTRFSRDWSSDVCSSDLRNFDEIYRALIAMQTADAFKVATPADWYPGDDVIVSPAGTCGVAEERMASTDGLECKDWFFCTKELDKDEVLNTILKE